VLRKIATTDLMAFAGVASKRISDASMAVTDLIIFAVEGGK
jgi:hypothetical protein